MLKFHYKNKNAKHMCLLRHKDSLELFIHVVYMEKGYSRLVKKKYIEELPGY